MCQSYITVTVAIFIPGSFIRITVTVLVTAKFSRNLIFIGFGKGVFWKRGLFRKVHFLEILESLEILEILENPPQTVENEA